MSGTQPHPPRQLPWQGPERRFRRLHPKYWRRQELVSSYTHAAAALLSLGALWRLVEEALRLGSPIHVFVAATFGLSMVALYIASAFLHGLPLGDARRVFEDLDLAGIFLMIAGTYTPFTLITLRGIWGWSLFGVVWTLSALGVAGVLWRKRDFEKHAAKVYLALGWLIVLAIRPLALALPLPGLLLLVGGGLAYSFGVIFFFWTRFLYHHAVWHLFVIMGNLMHFLAILLYVLPDMRGVAP